MVRGEQHPLATMTPRRVIAMRNERAKKRTPYAKLGRKHGVAAQTAYGICRGIRWAHVGGPLEVGPSRRGRRAGKQRAAA